MRDICEIIGCVSTKHLLTIIYGSLIAISLAGFITFLWHFWLKKLHGDGMLITIAAQKYSSFIHEGNITAMDEIRFAEILLDAFYDGKLKNSWSNGLSLNWVHYKIAFKYLEGIRRQKGLNKKWERATNDK